MMARFFRKSHLGEQSHRHLTPPASVDCDLENVGSGPIWQLYDHSKIASDFSTEPLNIFHQKDSQFVVRGIDFLPDYEKRRWRRRSHLPRFLRIDPVSWTSSYMRFLNSAHSNSTDVRTETSDQLTSSFLSHDSSNTCTSSENSRHKTPHLSFTPDHTILPLPDQARNLSEVDVSATSSRNDDSLSVMQVPSKSSLVVDESLELITDWMTFDKYAFENLVMSGGGSKGYAYIGALKALEDCGILKNIKRIAGSSAGAICAGLLAVGCSPQEIANVFKYDIKWLFHDQRCKFLCCIPGMYRMYGLHPAWRFYNIYGKHIAKKVGNPDITFKQLLTDYNCQLCIVVTNLSRMCSEYCSAVTCPDLPIRRAVRMSMAFPVVFHPVRCNITGRECLYTDGGILDQYPIHFFDGPDLNSNDADSGSETFNEKTLGLYVVSEKAIDYKIWKALFDKEIPYKPTYLPNTKLARMRLKREMKFRKRQNKQFKKEDYMNELRASFGDAVEMWDHYEVLNKSHIDISSFGDYFITTIEMLLISQRKLHVQPDDVRRTVPINCGYIGTNDYNLEPGDRAFMINQGYECTRRFLREFVSDLQQQQAVATLPIITVAAPATTRTTTAASSMSSSIESLDASSTMRARLHKKIAIVAPRCPSPDPANIQGHYRSPRVGSEVDVKDLSASKLGNQLKPFSLSPAAYIVTE